MEPGLYFTSKLNPILAEKDAKKRTAEAAAKAFTKRAFVTIAAKQFGISVRRIKMTHSYNFSLNYEVRPGMDMHVEPSSCGGAVTAWLERKEKAEKVAKEACAQRCRVAALLENGEVRSFIARLRAIFGSRKEYTDAQLRHAYKDWAQINASHTCPI